MLGCSVLVASILFAPIQGSSPQVEAKVNFGLLQSLMILPAGVSPWTNEGSLTAAWLKSQGVTGERLAKMKANPQAALMIAYDLKADGANFTLTQTLKEHQVKPGRTEDGATTITRFTFALSGLKCVGFDNGGNRTELRGAESLLGPLYSYERSPSVALVFRDHATVERVDAATGKGTKIGQTKAVVILRSSDSDVERLYAALTLVLQDRKLSIPYARYSDMFLWSGLK